APKIADAMRANMIASATNAFLSRELMGDRCAPTPKFARCRSSPALRTPEPARDTGPARRLRVAALRLLLLFPERQQALRRRTADHAGNPDRNLSKSRRRDAAQRNRPDTDLASEVQIAPRVRTLRLEFLDGG